MYCLACIGPAAKSLQPCPTLWDPIDGSPPGSAVPGILQARTQVGCHIGPREVQMLLGTFLLLFSHTVVSNSLWPHGLWHTRLLCPWGSPGSTVVGYHFLLQRIFSDQGSNLYLLYWQADSLPLNHQGRLVPYWLVSWRETCKVSWAPREDSQEILRWWRCQGLGRTCAIIQKWKLGNKRFGNGGYEAEVLEALGGKT